MSEDVNKRYDQQFTNNPTDEEPVAHLPSYELSAVTDDNILRMVLERTESAFSKRMQALALARRLRDIADKLEADAG